MVDTQDVAYGAAAITVTVIWGFLGCWFAVNILSSTQPVTCGFWIGFFILWLFVTISCLKTLIEVRLKN